MRLLGLLLARAAPSARHRRSRPSGRARLCCSASSFASSSARCSISSRVDAGAGTSRRPQVEALLGRHLEPGELQLGSRRAPSSRRSAARSTSPPRSCRGPRTPGAAPRARRPSFRCLRPARGVAASRRTRSRSSARLLAVAVVRLGRRPSVRRAPGPRRRERPGPRRRRWAMASATCPSSARAGGYRRRRRPGRLEPARARRSLGRRRGRAAAARFAFSSAVASAGGGRFQLRLRAATSAAPSSRSICSGV